MVKRNSVFAWSYKSALVDETFIIPTSLPEITIGKLKYDLTNPCIFSSKTAPAMLSEISDSIIGFCIISFEEIIIFSRTSLINKELTGSLTLQEKFTLSSFLSKSMWQIVEWGNSFPKDPLIISTILAA